MSTTGEWLVGRLDGVLSPGDRIPVARVWRAPREEPVNLAEALAGEGYALLCFYPFDWSPG